MESLPGAVTALSARLAELGWVSDLLVAGSLATGDYVPGVSDIDLVAIVSGPMSEERLSELVELHRGLDHGVARGADLGCVYVDRATLGIRSHRHPTWTHGSLVQRVLSGITRAELVRHGFAVVGRSPTDLLPPVTDDDVRRATRDELCGYWRMAAQHPRWWLSPEIADLGLTSMARARAAVMTGSLMTKGDAIESAGAPAWLISQMRARRRGELVVSPRLRSGWIAWRDAWRTLRTICH